MLRTHTREMPEDLREELVLSRKLDDRAIAGLWNEVHAWAFDHGQEVEGAYTLVSPNRTTRADEIASPLGA